MLGKKKESKAEEIEKEESVNQEKKGRISWLPIGLSLSFILLGALLIFIPALKPLHICYVLDGIAIAIGIVLIVHYFMTEAYKNVQRYGFSLGAILLLFGAIGLVKAQAISLYLLTLIGALLLMGAVIKLQNALDLKLLKDPYWYIWFLIAIVFAVLAAVVLLNPFGNQEDLEAFSQIVLFVDGIVSLVGTLYLFRRIRKKDKPQVEDGDEVPPEFADGPASDVEMIRPDEEAMERHVRNPGIQEDFDAGIDDD